jgi:hypothetical protein
MTTTETVVLEAVVVDLWLVDRHMEAQMVAREELVECVAYDHSNSLLNWMQHRNPR